MSSEELYKVYRNAMRKIADVKYATAVLQWDQETYLPLKGAEGRSRQLATLSEVAHEMFVDGKVGDMLNQLNDRHDLNVRQKKNILLSLEDFNKQKRFSSEFVRRLSEAVSAAFHAWLEARKANNFKLFEPALSKLVELKKLEAEIIGYEGHPYNALMNDYEKGATVSYVDKIFSNLVKPLGELLSKVEALQQNNDNFLHQHFPKQQQWEWGQYLAKQLGFNYDSGRQDISEHPFTINFSSQDVRITTRIDEYDFSNMTWSTIHEVGHALYEQGLPADEYGLPLGEYASLSIHESQSRLWENCIGRSRTFWEYHYPVLQSFFPSQFRGISIERFLKAINKVSPSPIRTDADELTYHYHVMIRYELEKKLIEGTLKTSEIPLYWNEQYKNLLGLDIKDDRNGCLQDVHWSHGSFGYFSTYSLGSFYAAQLWKQIITDIPDIQTKISSTGSTADVLVWLRNKIHLQGRYYTSDEVCSLISGSKLDSNIFVQYLENKLLG